jgi:Heavy metal binding domain
VLEQIKSCLVSLRRFTVRAMPSLALAVVETIAFGSFGCASASLLASRGATDPASPAASEAPFHAPEPTTFSSGAQPRRSGQSSPPTATAADAGVVYACPMHPDVQAQAPGHCPKCGMNLVPETP